MCSSDLSSRGSSGSNSGVSGGDGSSGSGSSCGSCSSDGSTGGSGSDSNSGSKKQLRMHVHLCGWIMHDEYTPSTTDKKEIDGISNGSAVRLSWLVRFCS